MKYIIILCDGMADFPSEKLGGKTPMEYAYIPNMHYMACKGRVGKIKTMYDGLPIGSIVANMGILGYDPRVYYPHGRASFEALAQGISIGENDVAFRCNLISLKNDSISDFTASNISDGEAKSIISQIKLDNKNIEIFTGQSYRNVMIYRNFQGDISEMVFNEPHCNIGKDINSILPNSSSLYKEITSELSAIMLKSKEQIAELNKDFKTKADMFWLWSASTTPSIPSFYSIHGKTGAIVASMDFLKGIGVAGKMFFENVPETNGYIDTSYSNKLKYAKRMIDKYDFVYIHINAPDEEGHNKNPKLKAKSLEYIDSEIIAGLMSHMRDNYGDDFRIAVLPDHYTSSIDGKHYPDEVPYLVYGKDIEQDDNNEFSEKQVKESATVVESIHFLSDVLWK